MDKKKLISYLSVSLIIITFIFATYDRIYNFPKAGSDFVDFTSHFYDMKKYYESGQIPVTGARFYMGSLNDESAPRVPGGFFYIHYLICYILGGKNLEYARVYNLISMLIPALIFLFWIFKRFGITIGSILSTLVLMNVYYFYTNMIFYNPNITLSLSFLFLALFGEYAAQKKSFLPAILLFPILALMGQAHFAVYYGIVPSVIAYLIVRYKKTRKNLIPLIIGVFISFLTYLPYLAYEIRNNFENLKKMIHMSSTFQLRNVFPFPQVHSLFMFPTNEFSVMYNANNLKKIIDFYLIENPYISFVAPILIISIIFSLFAVIFSIAKYFQNKEWKICYDSEESASKTILKETFLLFLIYFPTTIIITIAVNGIAGQFRYHYGAFALSFIPITYFLFYLKTHNKENLILIVLIFFILNTFAMNFNIITFYKKNQKPHTWKNYRETVKSISEDSKGEEFTIINENVYFTEMGIAYSKTGSWNEVSNAKVIYYVQRTENHTNMNLPIIESNEIYVVHKKIN